MASLADLQTNLFKNRLLEDQVALVRADRWKPFDSGGNDEDQLKLELTYARFDWLARCPQTLHFFCWPCVLFGKTTSKNGKGRNEILFGYGAKK